MVRRAPNRTEEELAAFKRRQRDRKTQLQREARQRARESSSQSATGAADRKPSDTQEAASASCPSQRPAEPAQDSSSSRRSQLYPHAHSFPEAITYSSREQFHSALVQPEKHHLTPNHDSGNMASDPANQQAAEPDPFADPAERRVFHAALDSFR